MQLGFKNNTRILVLAIAQHLHWDFDKKHCPSFSVRPIVMADVAAHSLGQLAANAQPEPCSVHVVGVALVLQKPINTKEKQKCTSSLSLTG